MMTENDALAISVNNANVVILLDGGLVQGVFCKKPIGMVQVIDLDRSDNPTEEDLQWESEKEEVAKSILGDQKTWTEVS